MKTKVLSVRVRPRQHMITTFTYKGKQYTTNNFKKKLEKLGITEKDIDKKEEPEKEKIKLYTFKNKKGEPILSIYPKIPFEGYERII